MRRMRRVFGLKPMLDVLTAQDLYSPSSEPRGTSESIWRMRDVTGAARINRRTSICASQDTSTTGRVLGPIRAHQISPRCIVLLGPVVVELLPRFLGPGHGLRDL